MEESYDKICAVLLDIFQKWDRVLKTKPYTEVDITNSADSFTAEVLYKIALFGGGGEFDGVCLPACFCKSQKYTYW